MPPSPPKKERKAHRKKLNQGHKKQAQAHAAAASRAEFDRLRRRAAQLCGADGIWSQAEFTWVGRRGAGRPRRTTSSTNWRRTEAKERLLTRLGMSEYYGSEGFGRPPSDVRVAQGTHSGTAAAIQSAMRWGWGVSALPVVLVFVCVYLRTYLVGRQWVGSGRPSHSCRVVTPPAR